MNIFLNKYKTVGLVILVGLILMLGGCKSKKMSVLDTSGYLKSKSHNEVLNDVLTSELNYKTITTKGKVYVKGKGYNAVFKLVKDEFMQVSIRAPFINIEAVRVNISPDKVVIIDRLMGRSYAELDMKGTGMNLMIAFNFYNLQALLTNQLFLAGNKNVSKADYGSFKMSVDDNKFILETKDKNKLLYNFAVDASDRIVSTAVTNSNKDMSLLWEYSDFVQDQDYIYPTKMTASINAKKKKTQLGISYDKLEINTEFEIDKSIPTKYKKVELTDLIKAFAKMM